MKKELSNVKYLDHRFKSTLVIRTLYIKNFIELRHLGNLVLFGFIQIIMGVQALISASAATKPSVFAWLLTPVIFSAGMFLLYKMLAWTSDRLKFLP